MTATVITTINGYCVQLLHRIDIAKAVEELEGSQLVNVTEVRYRLHDDAAMLVLSPHKYEDIKNRLQELLNNIV